MTGYSFSIWQYFWLGLLILLPVGQTQERNFRIIIDEFVPKASAPNFIDKCGCNLKQINMRSYLSCYFRILHPINELQMDSSLDLLRPNKPMVRLYNVHCDACEYLNMDHKNPLLIVFKKSISNAFNNTLKCPLKPVNEEIILQIHSLKTYSFLCRISTIRFPIGL